MRRRIIALGTSLIWILGGGGTSLPQGVQPQSIELDLAVRYFREASELCGGEAARLWGISLYGPTLLVDPESRMIVANQEDSEGRLRRQGELFVGVLPKEENIANTAMKWAGTKWTMLMWPLPEDRRARLRLLTHELFHRVQDRIGLAASDAPNRHLNSQAGRTWLRLEWRALQRALQERGKDRRLAIADAIRFRRYRQSLFPGSDAEERALESHEGIAEYTGLKLSSRSEGEFLARSWTALQQSGNAQSFIRSFAYSSGPAYGALLDAERIRWRSGFKAGDDLSLILARGLGIKPAAVSGSECASLARSYDGDEVIALETRREAIRLEAESKYRARLIDGPVLILPVAGSVNYSFNPNNLVPLTETGTVYPTMRVTDAWGILEVRDGALLIRSETGVKGVQVPAPSEIATTPLQGPGWQLELQSGWEITPGERKGDYILKKKSR